MHGSYTLPEPDNVLRIVLGLRRAQDDNLKLSSRNPMEEAVNKVRISMEHGHELDTKYVSSTFTLNFMPGIIRGTDILLNNKKPPKVLKVHNSLKHEGLKLSQSLKLGRSTCQIKRN